MRFPGGSLVCLLLLLCALLAGASSASAASMPVKGVDVDVVFGETSARATADVDAATRLGANTIRLGVDWSSLQPTARGAYAKWYLDLLDAVVARARKRNLKVVITPVFTPCWATTSKTCGTGTGTPPSDPADYAAMAAHLAKRWASALSGVEVWNEPNLKGFWNVDSPAIAYGKLLRATFVAVRKAAPTVKIVGGAVAGSDPVFLTALYASGYARYLDVLSVHAYNDDRSPLTRIAAQFATASFLQSLEGLRVLRAAKGDTRPVWITELGWNTSTQRGLPWLDGVSLGDQAGYLAQAIAMLQSSSSGIGFAGGAFVYRLRDIGTDPADPQQNYGLMTKAGVAKPAYAAVRAAFTASAAATGALPGGAQATQVAPATSTGTTAGTRAGEVPTGARGASSSSATGPGAQVAPVAPVHGAPTPPTAG